MELFWVMEMRELFLVHNGIYIMTKIGLFNIYKINELCFIWERKGGLMG